MSVTVLGQTSIRSPIGEFWRRFRGKRVALISLGLILVLVLAATLAPWIAPFDQATPDYDALLEGPSWRHLAGTDTFGRDIFSRMIWGGRVSLTVGFLSVVLGCVVGVAIGVISGFFGGWLDGLLMRIMDVMLAFPGIDCESAALA